MFLLLDITTHELSIKSVLIVVSYMNLSVSKIYNLILFLNSHLS